MDNRKREEILRSAALMDARDRAVYQEQTVDRYSHMSDIEKSHYIDLLKEMLANQKRQNDRLTNDNRRLSDLQESANAQLAKANDRINEVLDLLRQIQMENKGKDDLIKALQKQLNDANEKLKLNARIRFGSKSQKNKPKQSDGKKEEDKDRDRNQDEEDFDGTSESVGASEGTKDSEKPAATENHDDKKSMSYNEALARQARIGTSYNKMSAAEKITHASSLDKLPEGAVLIGFCYRTIYTQVVSVEGHKYQLVKYRYKGKLYTAYLPSDGEPEIIERVEGTHATPELLSYIAYDHFALDIPNYRKIGWFADHEMSLVRQTISNWLIKGANQLTKAIEHLKDIALEKDSIVNCDETWCRVKVYDTYKKRYIWCIVNKRNKVAFYFYDNGSRGRDVLKGILEGRELKALQSDGYNVYMFIDEQLVDMDHLCCMAHARAKFKYAAEQGDMDAPYILDRIGKLYYREALYKKCGYTPKQIKESRNGVETLEIIGEIRSKLDALMAEGHPPRGELMDKAVNYMHKFWKQLFKYRDDGEYDIDNSLAEQQMRTIGGYRKNSLFYGSSKMARAAACYHTIISTCRMQGISAIAYMKKFFREVVHGNTDYANLLPMTIGVCQ